MEGGDKLGNPLKIIQCTVYLRIVKLVSFSTNMIDHTWSLWLKISLLSNECFGIEKMRLVFTHIGGMSAISNFDTYRL